MFVSAIEMEKMVQEPLIEQDEKLKIFKRQGA